MAKRPASASQKGPLRRQMPRARREALLQRWILIGAGVLILAAVGVLGYGVLDLNYLKPNTTIVTVGDSKISGVQLENQVKLEYYFQLGQFGGQIPLSTYGLTPESYTKLILDSMTDDLIVEQKAKENGITVSDAEVLRELQSSFGYDAGTPFPTATVTETAVPTSGHPTATSTFVVTLTPTATRTPDPAGTATPTFTPTPTERATATPDEPATATPSPQPSPTPLDEAGYNTSFDERLDEISTATGLTKEQVKTAWLSIIRGQLLRQKLTEKLGLKGTENKLMIHAAHLLVATEEEAKAAQERINKGESFEKVAAELSLDTSNAYKGGDLGWFGPDIMDKDFQAGAESTEIRKVSGPVKSQFGWHLIKVYARKEVPSSNYERDQQVRDEITALLEQWKTELNVVVDEKWTNFVPTTIQ